MKKIFGLFCCIFTAAFCTAQTPVKSFTINLKPDETLTRIVSNGTDYAAKIIRNSASGTKEYYILTADGYKGPFETVPNLQYSFEGESLIFSAVKDGVFSVYNGNEQYITGEAENLFLNPRKIDSGAGRLDCMFIADPQWPAHIKPLVEDQRDTSSFYVGGSLSLGDYLTRIADYTLSGDGKVFAAVKESYFGLLSNTYSIYWSGKYYNYHNWDHFSSISRISLSEDGNTLVFAANKDDSSRETVYRMYGAVKNEYGPYRSVGNIIIDGFFDYCYYAARTIDGGWILHDGGDDKEIPLSETDIGILAKVPFKGSFYYSAKPGLKSKNGLEADKYYIFKDGSPVSGPFLEVGELLASNNSFAAAVKTPDGWYLIAGGNGIGPFESVTDLKFWKEYTLGCTLTMNGEELSVLLFGSGMELGSVIKTGGSVTGLIQYSGDTAVIYSD